MSHIWTPNWSYEKVDKTRCRHAVAQGGRSVGFYQCSRFKKLIRWTDPKGRHLVYKFCKQHHPDTVGKLRAKRELEFRQRLDTKVNRQERQTACLRFCAGVSIGYLSSHKLADLVKEED